MKLSRTQREQLASKLAVYGTTCAIIEKAIMHVGVVNAASKKIPVATIVGNIVAEYHKTNHSNISAHGA